MSTNIHLTSVIPRKKRFTPENENDLKNRVKTKKRHLSTFIIENNVESVVKTKKRRSSTHTSESNDKRTNHKLLNELCKSDGTPLLNKLLKSRDTPLIDNENPDEGLNCIKTEPNDEENLSEKENIQFDDILNTSYEEFNDEEINVSIDCSQIFEEIFQSEAKKKNCNMDVVKKQFQKKINSSINTKCTMATPSEIALLKSYGLKLFSKISEKYDNPEEIKNLNIKLPKKSKASIHYIESRLSRNPTKEQMVLIKTINPSVKLGAFSKEEDDMILKYWSKFQQEYNITNIQPFLSNGFEMALEHEQRFKFFRYLSQELPNRLLFSVFGRFNTLLGDNLNHESFEEKEDHIILKVKNCDAIKDKLSILSFLLSRSRLQISRRINTLKMEPFRTERIVWTDQLRQDLFSSILRVTKTVKWRKLKKLKITAQSWNEIAKNCPPSINAEKARIYWDTWMKTMLFSKETLHYSSMKLSILEFLLAMKPEKWSDINWVMVAEKLFPKISNKFVGTLFHSWVKYNVPEEQKSDIKKVLSYLSQNCKQDLIEKIQTGHDRPVLRLSVRGKDTLINLNKEKDD